MYRHAGTAKGKTRLSNSRGDDVNGQGQTLPFRGQFCRAVLAWIFYVSFALPAYSLCGDVMRPNMVLLSATETGSVQPGNARSIERTGIIVSHNGMVLTEIGLILDLLEGGASGNRDISVLFDPRRLANSLQIRLTHTQDGRLVDPIPVSVLGFDIARRLLLLKVPTVDQGYDAPSIRLGDFQIGGSRSVCTIGFKPDDSPATRWTLTTNDAPIMLSAGVPMSKVTKTQ